MVVVTSVGTAGSRVVVDVRIAVDHGVPVYALAAAVRERIVAHLAEQTGLVTTEVDGAVIDVRSHRVPPRRSAGTGLRRRGRRRAARDDGRHAPPTIDAGRWPLRAGSDTRPDDAA